MVLKSSVEPLGSLQLERTPRWRRSGEFGRGRRLASALQLNRLMRLANEPPVIG